MKILVLTNLFPPDVLGGYELGCRQVVDALRARGHEVRVLTASYRRPAPAPQPHVCRDLQIADIWSDYLFRKRVPVASHLMQHASHRVNAFNVQVLLRELGDFRPDVVYTWMLAGMGGLGLMGCLSHLRVPWVWHLMDDVPVLLCTAAGRVVPEFVQGFNRHLRGSFIVCSCQLADEIDRSGIVLRDEVAVVPNWIAGDLPPARAAYRADGTLRIVSAAAQVDRRGEKGLDLVVEAAAGLRSAGYGGFVVDLIGNVTDGSIPELLHRHGLESVVHLRGALPQAELIRRLAEYDVFAFPTREREPFGFAALEAAAMGCVPLITRTCGLAEWLVHGVHVLKAQRTAEAFAAAIAGVLDGQTDIAAIGRRAAGAARTTFTLDRLLPRIESTLRLAAAQDRSGGGTPEEAHRMAMLAERLIQVIVQEPLAA